jgi:hypothetical protein
VKARVGFKVEHLFHIEKNLFHYRRVRYRRLAKKHGTALHVVCPDPFDGFQSVTIGAQYHRCVLNTLRWPENGQKTLENPENFGLLG